jgi:acetyl-CoA carboxylase biotin carboxylase subunit
MFEKVLVANRGEIAVRVIRTCRELGIPTVAVYSTADADSAAPRWADESVCIGPAPSHRSYTNIPAIVEAARITGADAIHPGYGFLSEDPDFAEVCADEGLVFIGPRAETIRELGDKSRARARMAEIGLPLLPGTVEPVATFAAARAVTDEIGFPVIIKPVMGGGGKGMAVVREADAFPAAFEEARVAARAIAGDDRRYIERYVEGARHVEIQVLCDTFGTGIHLGSRDCSVQRRHQKLLEEAPAPGVPPELLAAISAAAVNAAVSVGYIGAGTFEFLLDSDDRFYFMEINTRIQVEHPVTEMVTGFDLVREQLHVAAGGRLDPRPAGVPLDGVSIECRVNLEDPARNFAPAAGLVTDFVTPLGPFVRVDTHGFPGYRFGPHYDSLLAKIIVWAPDREQAIRRMERALRECVVAGPGVASTIPFMLDVLSEDDFRKHRHDTSLVDRMLGRQPA